MYATCTDCTEITEMTKWEPKRKRIHKIQRRNWSRVRITTQSQQDEAKLIFSVPKTPSEACWEYGLKSDHSRSFHAVRGSYDSCRRRHWARKLVYRDTEYAEKRCTIIIVTILYGFGLMILLLQFSQTKKYENKTGYSTSKDTALFRYY